MLINIAESDFYALHNTISQGKHTVSVIDCMKFLAVEDEHGSPFSPKTNPTVGRRVALRAVHFEGSRNPHEC